MSESATEPVNVDAVARSITQDKLQVDTQTDRWIVRQKNGRKFGSKDSKIIRNSTLE